MFTGNLEQQCLLEKQIIFTLEFLNYLKLFSYKKDNQFIVELRALTMKQGNNIPNNIFLHNFWYKLNS